MKDRIRGGGVSHISNKRFKSVKDLPCGFLTEKIMDYKERYEKALKRAETAINIAADKDLVKGVATTIFPELRESEDERLRKLLVWQVHRNIEDETNDLKGSVYDGIKGHDPDLEESIEDWKKCLAYLEKQKESTWTEEDERIRKEIIDHLVKEVGLYPGEDRKEHRWLRWLERQKEQKPASAEDMPYITDERFFEREPKDSFRYKLAKYMTQNCRKEESPDGYTYHISAETILEMAKEELLKRGELQKQKPAEWSEEDETYLQDALWCVKQAVKVAKTENDVGACWSAESWLKSLRPVKQQWSEEDENKIESIKGLITMGRFADTNTVRTIWNLLDSLRPSWKPSEVCYGAKGDPDPAGVWKPSEEQMNALNALNCHGDLSYVGQQNQLISLQKDLEKLKGGVAPMREIDE